MTDDSANDLVTRAGEWFEIGRSAEAVALCHRALTQEADDASALHVLTMSLIALKQWDDAFEAGTQLLVVEPDLGLAHRLLSVIYQEIGSPEQAYAAAVGATRLDPLDEINHVQVALTAQVRRDRQQEARSAATRAVALSPESADAHFAVGFTSLDPAAQEEAYRRALAIDPEHAHAANNLISFRAHQSTAFLHPLATSFAGVLRSDPSYDAA